MMKLTLMVDVNTPFENCFHLSLMTRIGWTLISHIVQNLYVNLENICINFLKFSQNWTEF